MGSAGNIVDYELRETKLPQGGPSISTANLFRLDERTVLSKCDSAVKPSEKEFASLN